MNLRKSTTKNIKSSDLKFISMMIIAVVVWAFAFPFIKIGLEELSFINLTIMRFLVVCLIFLIIFILKTNKFSKLQKSDIIPISILGFFGVIVYHFGLNYGEQYISPGIASLIIATIPIQIVILARVILKEKISYSKYFGIILALIGVLVISIWGKAESSLEIEYAFGAVAILIAAILAALYTIAGKRLLERYNGLSLTVYAILLGSIGLIPFFNNSLITQVTNMSLRAWFAVVFLGIFSTVIGYVIWYVALRLKSASEISIYLYAIPVLSTIISYFWFNDEITIMFILGGFLVLFGLYLVNAKKEKNKQKG
jgi:drug/metabolite transporter (DMT)-like permease